MTLRSILIFMFATLNAQVLMSDCKELDAKKLETLVIPSSVQTEPGKTFRIRTFLRECCVFDTDVHDLCATWAMDPTEGVKLNNETGELIIDKSVPPGTTFDVTAKVQNSSWIYKTKVTVFTPEQNPFVGMWQEAFQVDCETGKTFSPAVPIREIEFHADGQFTVTWTPFEVYRDYGGTYTFDLKKGTFTVSDLGGNYVPKDVGTGGTFTFPSDRSLVLKDFWFGSRHTEKPEVLKKACGHHLFR